jgi:hypothetical protein
MHVYISTHALQHMHPKVEQEAVYHETNKSHNPIPWTEGTCLTDKAKDT